MSFHDHQVSGGRVAVTSQVGHQIVIADLWNLQFGSVVTCNIMVFIETKITFLT
jgi:hypothetical protein